MDMSPFIAIERSPVRCEQCFSGTYCHLCLVGLWISFRLAEGEREKSRREGSTVWIRNTSLCYIDIGNVSLIGMRLGVN